MMVNKLLCSIQSGNTQIHKVMKLSLFIYFQKICIYFIELRKELEIHITQSRKIKIVKNKNKNQVHWIPM